MPHAGVLESGLRHSSSNSTTSFCPCLGDRESSDRPIGHRYALSRRALEAEENFQRLISAVERLCERRKGIDGAVLDLPFERQLSERFNGNRAFRIRFPAAHRLKEDDGKPSASQPMTRI